MAVLLVVFAIRLAKTKKFMPSGLMLVVTIAGAGVAEPEISLSWPRAGAWSRAGSLQLLVSPRENPPEICCAGRMRLVDFLPFGRTHSSIG